MFYSIYYYLNILKVFQLLFIKRKAEKNEQTTDSGKSKNQFNLNKVEMKLFFLFLLLILFSRLPNIT
jgi:hypothetical protein